MTDYLPYTLAFSRLVVGLVFLFSFSGKVRSPDTFKRTIANFRLLPPRLHSISARLFLSGELAVIILLLIGKQWLLWGFILAFVLLLGFTGALASALIRKIQISCNCFGPTEKNISVYDLGRNSGFIFCALVGSGMSQRGQVLTFVEWLAVGFAATVYVLIWLSLRDILELIAEFR